MFYERITVNYRRFKANLDYENVEAERCPIILEILPCGAGGPRSALSAADLVCLRIYAQQPVNSVVRIYVVVGLFLSA